MIFRSFLVGGAIALRASAFLVVPDVEGNMIAPQGLRQLEIQDAQQLQIHLPCTECPFREASDSWTEGFETSLSLSFSVEDNVLMVNGHQIFPPPPPSPLQAVQTRVDNGAESEPVSLGYVMEVMPLAEASDESGAELLAIRFTVLDLDSRPVPLDTVAITLIRDSFDQLYMVKTDVEKTPKDRLSWEQCQGSPRCLQELLFNRMRGVVAAAQSKISGLTKPKGCHRGRPAWADHADEVENNWVSSWREDDGPGDDDGRPEHHRPGPPGGRPHGHRHHRHHHKHHSQWERTFSRLVRFIVVPAILGVMAGLTASALGMLVGQIVVFLWLRYRRQGSQRSAIMLEQGSEPEKQSLMAETSEEPPVYSSDEGFVVSPSGKN